MGFFELVCHVFLLFVVVGSRVCVCVCVCDDDLCCFPSDVCYFVQQHMLAGSWLSDMEICAILTKLGTPPISAPTPKSHHKAKTWQHKKCTPDPIASVLGAVPG
jgi:hypothetical protein